MKELKFFREDIEYVQNYESDEEELPPPDFAEECDNRSLLKKAKLLLQTHDYKNCVDMCSEVLQHNPDNATAYRVRSQAYNNMNVSDKAYSDMCEAQKLDYDEEYNILHSQMREAYKRVRETPKSNNNMPSLNDIDMNSLLNNPDLMNMANQMMRDPNVMQNMQNMMRNMNR